MFRLDGKIAVITGAGSGIGRAMAVLFATQGAQVVAIDLHDTNVQQICRQQPGMLPLVADVGDEAAVSATFAMIVRQMKRIDILVNNAGISSVGTILETSLDEWEQVLRTNARGVFLCARAGVRQMLTQVPSGGVILNMASATSLVGVEQRCAYTASKGAVLALTRSIAIDYAQQSIRCVAICPGTVHTPFIEAYLATHYAGREEETRQTLGARQPLGRMADPEEIAAAALYLASEEAAFITGSPFIIDGGWTAR